MLSFTPESLSGFLGLQTWRTPVASRDRFEQVLGNQPIRAFYLSTALIYSRMQLPRSYDHLSLPSTSALLLHPRLQSHYPRFNALQTPVVRLIASSGNKPQSISPPLHLRIPLLNLHLRGMALNLVGEGEGSTERCRTRTR